MFNLPPNSDPIEIPTCVFCAVIGDAALLFEPNRSPRGRAVRESVLRLHLSGFLSLPSSIYQASSRRALRSAFIGVLFITREVAQLD